MNNRYFWYTVNIDGHGVGVEGGAPMHDEQKLPDTRREKKQGGVHPGVRSTPGKKKFDPPLVPKPVPTYD